MPKIKIINVYAPHKDYSISSKDAFYNQMRKCTNEMDKFTSYQCAICGDSMLLFEAQMQENMGQQQERTSSLQIQPAKTEPACWSLCFIEGWGFKTRSTNAKTWRYALWTGLKTLEKNWQHCDIEKIHEAGYKLLELYRNVTEYSKKRTKLLDRSYDVITRL